MAYSVHSTYMHAYIQKLASFVIFVCNRHGLLSSQHMYACIHPKIGLVCNVFLRQAWLARFISDYEGTVVIVSHEVPLLRGARLTSVIEVTAYICTCSICMYACVCAWMLSLSATKYHSSVAQDSPLLLR